MLLFHDMRWFLEVSIRKSPINCWHHEHKFDILDAWSSSEKVKEKRKWVGVF